MPFIQFYKDDEYQYLELKGKKQKFIFGREEDVDFRISADSQISRHHFAIEKDKEGNYQLVNLGARNGTYFNGKRISGEVIILNDGDRIKAGRQSFIFYDEIPEETTDTVLIEMTPFPKSSFKNQEDAVRKLNIAKDQFNHEISKVIIGQQEIIDRIMIALLARGHCLLIGVPGLAKTLIVRVLAGILELDTNRIQFTPDLMPSDVTGTDILEEDAGKTRRFRFNYGPIFTNILLADEINRTPPKTQAALLEAMQEHKVTAGGVTYRLPEPFLVLATQNPIEQEGTYPLPEAQLDRFMFCLNLDYPSAEEEQQILLETTRDYRWEVEKVLDAETIIKFQHLVRQVPISDHVAKYTADLIRATRPGTPDAPEFISRWLRWGVGPRAGQFLLFAAKAHVLLDGRSNVSCADIREFALPVLRHRIFANFAAVSDGVSTDDIIKRLLEHVQEPEYKK